MLEQELDTLLLDQVNLPADQLHVFRGNDSAGETRTQKVFAALDEICHAFDLSAPIWLDHNISEFQRIDKTRFTSDNFIDSIEFDFLEIHVFLNSFAHNRNIIVILFRVMIV